MQVRNVRVLRGPNIWTQTTLLEVWLELDASAPATSLEIEAFRDALAVRLPRIAQPLDDACCCEAELSSARSRGLLVAELMARTIAAVQLTAGSEVTFVRVAESHLPGMFKVAVEFRQAQVGKRALDIALELWAAVRSDQPYDLDTQIETLRDLDQQHRLGPSTNSIVQAAVRRGIPFRRLNTESLVQIGYGSKQHRILAAATDKTSAVAEDIVQDKDLTKQLLAAIGVPVPRGRVVTSSEDAWAAAQEIGVPVVVKPQDGNQGRGVAVNLHAREQVVAGYAAALARSEEVIVEKYAPGADYRLLVINNKLVAAARREPPQVMGDGRRTIRELVDEVNRDPRRGEHHATSLSKIPLDAIALGVLAEQGLTAESVPAAGQLVLLRRNANLSTGGSATDVTDLVHPEVAGRVVDAARMVGLDIAGVDVIAQDISRPLEQQSGVIIEVNAAPGLRMHLEPSFGQGRPVGEAIVNMMFPEGDSGRIPIVAVTGVNGKTTTTRLSAHILRCWGKRTGLTCTEGVYIDDRLIDEGDCSGPNSARNVLSNPMVDAAAFETARGGILREGLGFDQCDAAIVTNIGDGDHLGLMGIETVEQLARVKRVPVENVAPNGYAVLNAADPLVVAMADYCPGRVLFFARSADQPVLASHRAKGGKVVFVRDNAIIAAEGTWEAKIADLASVPMTLGGAVGFQIENAMAAAGAAWTLGVPFQVIRHALETFICGSVKAPGRFNVLHFRGATIVLDYGHNTSALKALIDGVSHFHAERRVILYTATGDRRDQDIVAQGELVAAAFDEWVLFQDYSARGRKEGEVVRLLQQGIRPGCRVRKCHEPKGGERAAIEYTLGLMQPGDLLVVQVDQVLRAMDWIEQYLARLGHEAPTAEKATLVPAKG
jgi:cyanophycin synthetase